jgi:hypothetical protein
MFAGPPVKEKSLSTIKSSARFFMYSLPLVMLCLMAPWDSTISSSVDLPSQPWITNVKQSNPPFLIIYAVFCIKCTNTVLL